MSQTAPLALTEALDTYGAAAISRELRNRALRRILTCPHDDVAPLLRCRGCHTMMMYWPGKMYRPDPPDAERVSTHEWYFRYDEHLRSLQPGRYRWLKGPSLRERTMARVGLYTVAGPPGRDGGTP